MSIRRATVRLSATAMVLAALPAWAIATKPPDLPLRQTIVCTQQTLLENAGGAIAGADTLATDGEPLNLETPAPAQDAPIGAGILTVATEKKPEENNKCTVLFGVSINSGSAVIGGLAFGQVADDRIKPGMHEAFNYCWQVLMDDFEAQPGLLGVDVTGELPLLSLRKQSNATGFTCPYLKQRATASQSLADQKALSATVIDNIHKLEDARALFEEAEQNRIAGKLKAACTLYERLENLCPGSRLASEAQAKREQLHTAKADAGQEASTEEQEPASAGHNASAAVSSNHQKPYTAANYVRVRCRFRIGLAHLDLNVNANQDDHGTFLFGLAMDSDLFIVPGWLMDNREFLTWLIGK